MVSQDLTDNPVDLDRVVTVASKDLLVNLVPRDNEESQA